MATGGIVSSFIAARDEAADRARQRTQDAYVAARRPVVDAQNDQMAGLKIQGAQNELDQSKVTAEDTATDRERKAHDLMFSRRAQFVGAVAKQLESAPPGTKASDIAKNAPQEVRDAIGMDDAQLAHFAQVYDDNPQQLAAAAQMYGGPDKKVAKVERAAKDGATGSLVTFADGSQHFTPGATADKEFAPQKDTSAVDAARIALMASQAEKNGAQTAATSAKAGTGAAADGAAQDLLATMDQYKQGLVDLDKQGGMVKTGGNIVSNALNVGGATGAGKVVGSILGDKNTAARQRLDEIAPTILHTYAAALGLKSAQLNTEKEYQRFKAVLSDQNAPLETRLQALNDLQTHVRNAVAARGGGAAKKSGTVSLDDFLKE